MECKNCKQELFGEQKFCSNCGQKNISELTLRYLFNEIVDNVLNLDSKMFSTVKYLLLKPGYLTKEFVQSRRKRYVSPVKFYLITSLIFFVIVSLVNLFDHENIDTVAQEEESLSSRDSTNSVISFNFNESSVSGVKERKRAEAETDTTSMSKDRYFRLKEAGELDSYMIDSLGYEGIIERLIMKKIIKNQYEEVDLENEMLNQLSFFLLLFIPLMSLIYKISFLKNGYNYISHVIFNMHFNSFVIIVLGVNELFKLILRDWYDAEYAIYTIFVVVISYLFIAIKKFYERKWWVVLYKLFLLFIGYILLASLFSIILVLASILVS